MQKGIGKFSVLSVMAVSALAAASVFAADSTNSVPTKSDAPQTVDHIRNLLPPIDPKDIYNGIAKKGWTTDQVNGDISYENALEDAKRGNYKEGSILLSVEYYHDSYPANTSVSDDADKTWKRYFWASVEGGISFAEGESKNPINDLTIDFIPATLMDSKHYEDKGLEIDNGIRIAPMTLMRDQAGGTKLRATVSVVGYSADIDKDLIKDGKLSAYATIAVDALGARYMHLADTSPAEGFQLGRFQAEIGLHYNLSKNYSVEGSVGTDRSLSYGDIDGTGSRWMQDQESYAQLSLIRALGDRYEVALTGKISHEKFEGQDPENLITASISFEGASKKHKHFRRRLN